MLIELSGNYRIKSDDRNIIVERKHIVDPTKSPNWPKKEAEGADPTPRVEWREVSYHSTVPQAVASIGNQQVRDSDAGTLAELLAEIKGFHREIRELMTAEGIR